MLKEIEEEWLGAVAGKILFYPAAGEDTAPFIDAFGPYIRQFHFNDLRYSTSRDRRSAAPPRFKIIATQAPDRVLRDMPLTGAGGYRRRDMDPSTLVERLADQEFEIMIYRRRGFGQYALGELPNGSIGVFVHRSDSIGESGSNMWFLANRAKHHEPLANLWDKLAIRLADRSIIVSDGSLTDFEFLIEAKAQVREGVFDPQKFGEQSQNGFVWRCIGEMSDRTGTLVWGLTRLTSPDGVS